MNTSQIAHWFNKIEVVQEYWTVILTVNAKCARARIYTSSIKNNKASWTSKPGFESGEQMCANPFCAASTVRPDMQCSLQHAMFHTICSWEWMLLHFGTKFVFSLVQLKFWSICKLFTFTNGSYYIQGRNKGRVSWLWLAMSKMVQ